MKIKKTKRVVLLLSVAFFSVLSLNASGVVSRAEAMQPEQGDCNAFVAWKDCNAFNCWNFIDCNCNYQQGRKMQRCFPAIPDN